jgi:pimeloyl-ACP methyl ester carboxylesterase
VKSAVPRQGDRGRRQDVLVTSDAITLPDGRRLHWDEFGDKDGSPVVYTAGTPVSGLGGVNYDQPALAAGLRWISPDKPGYGGSDYHRERSLVSWAADIAALAGHLGLDRFALAGESGGGPFTLAAAHQLAGRVNVAALIATGGPIARAEMVGQQARIRLVYLLATTVPALNWIPISALRRGLVNPARRNRALDRDLATMPAATHAALRIEYEAVTDALRPGSRATVQELAMTKRPWPFPLSEVTTPVHLWHGAVDRNAPIAFARRLARGLPNATLHVSDSSAHDVGHDRCGEIMSVLASHFD